MGDNHRMIGLGSIVSALGSVELAELPGFHAFSGADIIGRKGKRSWRQKIPKLLWKPWNRSASPRRDIGPCGEVYMPALSPWNRYLTSQGTKMACVQKKSGRIGKVSANTRGTL